MPRRFDPAALDRFLAELTRTGRLARAVAASGCSRSGLFKHRARDPGFAQRWDAALASHQPAKRLRRRRLGHPAERIFLAAVMRGAPLRAAAEEAGFAHSSFLARARTDPGFAALLKDALITGRDRRFISRRRLDRDPSGLVDIEFKVPDELIPMSPEQILIQLHLHRKNGRLQRHVDRRFGAPKPLDQVKPEILALLAALQRMWRWQETGRWLGEGDEPSHQQSSAPTPPHSSART